MNIVKLMVAITFVALTSGCETLSSIVKTDTANEQSDQNLKQDAKMKADAAKKAAADKALKDAFRADALNSANVSIDKLAAQGNVYAQFSLGREYELGIKRNQNFNLALHWYQQSAAQGNLSAQSALGDMYNEGRGVVKNQTEAARWYKLAAINAAAMKQKNAEKLKQDEEYIAIVRACVKVGISFKTPIPQTQNVSVSYQVLLERDGTPSKINLLRSSGNTDFDKQVSNGISKCVPFPKLQSGSYPRSVNLIYYMYDRKL